MWWIDVVQVYCFVFFLLQLLRTVPTAAVFFSVGGVVGNLWWWVTIGMISKQQYFVMLIRILQSQYWSRYCSVLVLCVLEFVELQVVTRRELIIMKLPSAQHWNDMETTENSPGGIDHKIWLKGSYNLSVCYLNARSLNNTGARMQAQVVQAFVLQLQ